MLYLIIVSIIWSFTFNFLGFNLVHLDPNFTTFLRVLFALPFFIIALNVSKISFIWIIRLIFLGAIQYGLTYVFRVQAYTYTDAYSSISFTSTLPIYVTLITMLYERKILYKSLITSFISFLAVGFILYDGLKIDPFPLNSFLFSQLGTMCLGFGQVQYKIYKSKLSQVKDIEIFALMLLGALFVIAIATTISNGWGFLEQIPIQEFGIIVYIGLVIPGLCWFMWNKGSQLVNNGVLAILNNLKLTMGILNAILIFKKDFNLIKTIIALLIILICLVIESKKSNYDVL